MQELEQESIPISTKTFGPVKLEILPGDHNITVSFSRRSASRKRAGERYTYLVFYEHKSIYNVDISIKTEAGHTYLLSSSYDLKKSRWYVVVLDQTKDKSILKVGPYPLRMVRTGDNREARRTYRE